MIEEIETAARSIEALLAEARTDLLPTSAAKQSLANRMDTLSADLTAVIREYRAGVPGEYSEAALGKFLARLTGEKPALLESTVVELRAVHAARLVELGAAPVIHLDQAVGTLAEKLKGIMATAVKTKTPVRYLHLRSVIRHASPEERRAAAEDVDLLESAAEWMSPRDHNVPEDQAVPQDFPDFAVALGVRMTGKVVPLPDDEVDAAIRSTLAEWLTRPIGRGVTVPGNVVSLNAGLMKAVMRKYTIDLAGQAGVTAFTEGGTIFLNPAKGDPTTIVHEGIHLYASGAFKRRFGGALDEGMTEYFGRKVAAAMGKVRAGAYDEEHDQAAAMVTALTESAVALLYFAGDSERLEGHFLNRRKAQGSVGKDAAADWVRLGELCTAKKWADVALLLR